MYGSRTVETTWTAYCRVKFFFKKNYKPTHDSGLPPAMVAQLLTITTLRNVAYLSHNFIRRVPTRRRILLVHLHYTIILLNILIIIIVEFDCFPAKGMERSRRSVN